ncbi:MAG: universal stress protein [Bacteroidales bacterium]|jgi:nucleotide-binding universal stress UspA family protein|nr:universal stress protein [Bacteroidales bacterium]
MEVTNKLIVVPWDFTEVAGNALKHAARIARQITGDIVLLHILDKTMMPGVEAAKRDKLRAIAEDAGQQYNLTVKHFLTKGSIFTAIGDYVNDNEANLVVMGTHGMKGMQKLTGSWALKVIVRSKAPFIVVQDPPNEDGKFGNIVFTVDFHKENKDKLSMAIFMGKYFESKVHLLKTQTTDKNLLKKTNINVNFAIKYFTQNNIEYEIHEIPKGNLTHQTIDFAQKINADMIVLVTSRNNILGASEQYIIANSSKIPVCCVNPRSTFAGVGQFMYSG